MKEKRYWISWYQPGEDYRPLKWPLPKKVEYWCSGFNDEASTLCCLIQTDKDPKEIIREFWPEAEDFRFEDEVEIDWVPTDRFPLSKNSFFKG